MAKRLLPLCLLTLLPLLTGCGEFYEFDQQEAIAAGEMTLGRQSVDLMVGDRFEIPVMFQPETLSNEAVFWLSDNEDVVKFEDNTLLAVGEGTAVVTVISVSGQYQATCTVNVHPVWSFNPNAYAYDMVFYANVTVHGEQFSDDMYLVAYCDDEIRGIAQIREDKGIRYVLIRVYSNFTEGDEIQFKVYKRNSALVEVFPDVVVFDGESHGSLSNLYPLSIE
ncbi:MAG: hypothetical protein IJ577_07480 [Prevotella sp.]|nr:hypothetical protein [Prevotella sp.]